MRGEEARHSVSWRPSQSGQKQPHSELILVFEAVFGQVNLDIVSNAKLHYFGGDYCPASTCINPNVESDIGYPAFVRF